MKGQTLPLHVGIIMDGNGRWAESKGLPRVAGHAAGAEKTVEIVKSARKLGIKWLTLFAFSTENWKRPKSEIEFLFRLMYKYSLEKLPLFLEENVRFKAIGRLEEIPDYLVKAFRRFEEETKDCSAMTAVFAVNYGGRQEIIDAVKKLKEIGEEKITQESFRRYLYLPEMPDLDLLIRTSGEMRISNFLLWQSAYTELWFTDTYWPDFSQEEFERAINDFSKRDRRFGGI